MSTNKQIVDAARAIDPKADLSVSGGDVNTIVWENGYSGINIDVLKEKIVEIETQDINNKYQISRKRMYPNFGDQLDSLYKDILTGKLDSTGDFAKAIKAVKDANPKP
jgi:hypothetical protein